jgi:hypothetical protein
MRGWRRQKFKLTPTNIKPVAWDVIFRSLEGYFDEIGYF